MGNSPRGIRSRSDELNDVKKKRKKKRRPMTRRYLRFSNYFEEERVKRCNTPDNPRPKRTRKMGNPLCLLILHTSEVYTKERNEINAIFKYQGLRHNHKSRNSKSSNDLLPSSTTNIRSSLQSTQLTRKITSKKRNAIKPQGLYIIFTRISELF